MATTKDYDENFILYALADGKFGLAKTFWLFGVAAGIIFSIIIRFISNQHAVNIIYMVIFFYNIFYLIGVWSSSDLYKGFKLWKILAKLHVVFGAVGIIFFIVKLLEK